MVWSGLEIGDGMGEIVLYGCAKDKTDKHLADIICMLEGPQHHFCMKEGEGRCADYYAVLCTVLYTVL